MEKSFFSRGNLGPSVSGPLFEVAQLLPQFAKISVAGKRKL